MIALADMGTGGIALLAVFLLALLDGLAGLALWIDYVVRPHGAHAGGERAGLDVVSSPASSPAGSMQLADDLEAWEPHRFDGSSFLTDTTGELWPRGKGQYDLEQFAPGAWRRPQYPGSGSVPSDGPLPVPGMASPVPDEHGPGHSLSGQSRPVRPAPEVAHDEYSGREVCGHAAPRPGPTAADIEARAYVATMRRDLAAWRIEFGRRLAA